jgi:hypothetical protein
MNKAKQLVLGTMFGLPSGHSIVKDLLADPDVVALAEVAVLTREDFFTAENNGKSFFEYPEIWEKMDEVVAALREKGLDIKGSDFTANIPGSTTKTPLSMANDLDVLGKIFTPVIWKGQHKPMIDAWYSLESWSPKKNKVDWYKVQEETAATEGKISRAAQLKKMGLEYDDIRTAIHKGNYEKINKRMAEHGDHLRKDDVFVLDKSGDHTLDVNDGWTHFGKLWDELAKHGERLEVEDFLFHCAKRDSILKDAEDLGDGLKELFKPRLWYGRTADVVKLYGMLSSDSARAKVPIDSILDDLANHEYGQQLDCGKITELKHLTDPVNASESGKPNFHPIRPLALKAVWNQIACIQKSLVEHGQPVTLDHLRERSGLRDETCLIHAARYGSFDKVMDIMRETGGKLTVEELTTKDKDGKNIIVYLVQNNQVDQILQPRDWLGRGPELARLWPQIPEKSRDKINFQELIGTLNTLALRERFSTRLPAPGIG